MTYYVLSGTLNSTHSMSTVLVFEVKTLLSKVLGISCKIPASVE